MREVVVALSRKVLGPMHPGTLGAMNNLALSYSDAGRRDEALKMQEGVLALCREVFGYRARLNHQRHLLQPRRWI